MIRAELVAEIRKGLPEWSPELFICRQDLAQVRGRYVHSLLESERGELSSLEHEVIRSLREQELLSTNVDAKFQEN